MSRTILFTLAALASPLATSQAQSPSPERALLNSITASYRVVVADHQSPIPTIDGDRALLGRSAGVSGAPSLTAGSSGDTLVVNAEQALLGHVGSTARRRLTLAW